MPCQAERITFDIEFRAKIDLYSREGVVVPVEGGFDALPSRTHQTHLR